MSRETELQALRQVKENILAINSLLAMGNEELEKYEKARDELVTTKFQFHPLPTDNEQSAKNRFVQAWKDTFTNTRKFKIVFLVLYTLAMLAFSVVVFLDMHSFKGWLFAAEVWTADEMSGFEVLLIYVAQIVFSVTAILIPWFHSESDWIRGLFLPILIAYGVSGLLFLYTVYITNSYYLLFAYLIATAAAFILGFIIHGICLLISKVPVLSARQKAILAEERRKDADNAAQNKINEEKERTEWQTWWDTYKYELDEKMDIHMDTAQAAVAKAEEYDAAIDAMDVLGENEKNLEVVDWLLYFIESHRADSIKEALHEYDKMLQNKKMLELEKIKFDMEVAKAQKENADRRHQMEQNRRHQLEMEVQAARTAASQERIAADTAAMRDSAERMRRDLSAIRQDTYYNTYYNT